MSKNKLTLTRIAKVVFGICLVLCSVFFSFLTFAVNGDIYYKEQRNIGVTGLYVGLETEDNLIYLDHVIADYMIGRIDDMDVEVEIHGVPQHVWSEQALRHMADVRVLLITWTYICSVMALYCIGYVVYFARSKSGREHLHKAISRTYMIALAVIIGIVLIALAIGFSRAFDIFHYIFFSNGDWLFYYDDLLVNMLPEDLFLHFAILGTVLTVVNSALITLLSSLSRRIKPSIKHTQPSNNN